MLKGEFAPADFSKALSELALGKNDLRMLRAHYESPKHTISPREMSAQLGWNGPNPAKLLYGRLAGRIARALDWSPDTGGDPYNVAAIARAYWPDGGELVWEMRPAFATAVSQIIGRENGDRTKGKVFISYSQRHRVVTEHLARYLEKAGYDTWWDTNLVAGEAYREIIDRELETADAVIVIWTEESVASAWVIAEAEHGARQNKLVPVRASDLDASRIPKPFSVYHTALVEEPKGIVAAIELRLAAAK